MEQRLSPGRHRAWGGYSGIFVDLDGHSWEIEHNPAWTVRPDVTTTLYPEHASSRAEKSE